ncbi:MAG TPA: M48 family metallopeptidase, partial [Acidimicrobiales bacterium]
MADEQVRAQARDNESGSDEPLLRLPPVELPPAAATGETKAAGLAGRALLSIVLLLGVIVLAVGVVVGLVALNVGLARLGRVHIGVILLTFAVVAALGRSTLAMLRKPPEPADEVEVPPDAEPELHAEVRRLAQIAGTEPPDRIAVVADVNAYVREFGPLLGMVRGKRTLAIGVPLLDVLDVSELRAVLAHEMGHFAGGDTRLGPIAYRTELALHKLVESLAGNWVASIFYAYWKFQHRVSARVVRGQELV